MEKIDQVLVGCLGFLGYMVFFVVYATVVSPAWTVSEYELYATWYTTSKMSGSLDTLNSIIFVNGAFHNGISLLVFPLAPVGVIGRIVFRMKRMTGGI